MKENIHDLVEGYLSGTLGPEVRSDFEQRLAADRDLASRVMLEMELAATLRTAMPENQLISSLGRLSAKFDTPESLNSVPVAGKRHRWSGLIVGIGLLVVVGLIIWRSSIEKKIAVPQNTHSTPVLPAPDLPAARLPVEPEPSTGNEKAGLPHKSQTIAAAFIPLPKLEAYIGSQVRGDGIQISISEPHSGTPLKRTKGKVFFRLSGESEGPGPQIQKYNLLIFNNNTQLFENYQPLEMAVLDLAEGSSFHWEKWLTVSPGLYYFIIEQPASGEWLFVDKFLVN